MPEFQEGMGPPQEKKELQEVGNKLNVSSQDIENIRKKTSRSRIWYIIISAVIAILSFILGYFIGRSTVLYTPSLYPYAPGIFAPGILINKKLNSRVAILLMAAIGFLVAFKSSRVFGANFDPGVTLYGVYFKRR